MYCHCEVKKKSDQPQTWYFHFQIGHFQKWQNLDANVNRRIYYICPYHATSYLHQIRKIFEPKLFSMILLQQPAARAVLINFSSGVDILSVCMTGCSCRQMQEGSNGLYYRHIFTCYRNSTTGELWAIATGNDGWARFDTNLILLQ